MKTTRLILGSLLAASVAVTGLTGVRAQGPPPAAPREGDAPLEWSPETRERLQALVEELQSSGDRREAARLRRLLMQERAPEGDRPRDPFAGGPRGPQEPFGPVPEFDRGDPFAPGQPQPGGPPEFGGGLLAGLADGVHLLGEVQRLEDERAVVEDLRGRREAAAQEGLGPERLERLGRLADLRHECLMLERAELLDRVRDHAPETVERLREMRTRTDERAGAIPGGRMEQFRGRLADMEGFMSAIPENNEEAWERLVGLVSSGGGWMVGPLGGDRGGGMRGGWGGPMGGPMGGPGGWRGQGVDGLQTERIQREMEALTRRHEMLQRELESLGREQGRGRRGQAPAPQRER